MNGSEPFRMDTADWINLGKNLLIYLLAALVTWCTTVLVPTLETSGGIWATIAIGVALLLKVLERFTRDTRGTIDGARR